MKFYWIKRLSIGLCYSVFAIAFFEAAPLWDKAPSAAFILMSMAIIAALFGTRTITSLIYEVQRDTLNFIARELRGKRNEYKTDI